MALTITVLSTGVHGRDRTVVADIGFDASYPTNGLSLVPKDVGFANDIYAVISQPRAGILADYDRANKKLRAFWFNYPGASAAAAVEVANATNLAGSVVTAFILGN